MADEPEDEEAQARLWSEMGRYAHLGFQLALATGLFLAVGWWLDGKLGTTPLLTIVGAMGGAAAGFYSMYHQMVVEPRQRAAAASCSALVVAGVVGSWPLLDPLGRGGTLVAAAVALPLQVATFAALRAGWNRSPRFLAAWLGGTLLRLVAVLGMAVLVSVTALPPAPTLLATAGFFVAMLLTEPLFLGRVETQLAETR